jgi:hypothetical protein
MIFYVCSINKNHSVSPPFDRFESRVFVILKGMGPLYLGLVQCLLCLLRKVDTFDLRSCEYVGHSKHFLSPNDISYPLGYL